MIMVKVYRIESYNTIIEEGAGHVSIKNNILTVESNSKIVLESNIKETHYTRQCETELQCSDQYIICFTTTADLSTIWLEILAIKGDDQLEFMVAQLKSEEFLSKLCHEFLLEPDNQQPLFELFKLIINSCTENLFRVLLYKENFPTLLKVLELDPELKGKKNYCKDFNTSVLNNVLNITDTEFLELINLNFRIQVFRDALLTKTFDERVGVVLNSMQVLVREEIIKCYCMSGEIRSGLVIEMEKNTIAGLKFFFDLLELGKSVRDRFKLYEIIYADELLNTLPIYWRNKNFKKLQRLEARQIIILSITNLFQIMPWNLKDVLMYTGTEKTSFFQEFLCKGMDLDIEHIQSLGQLVKLFLESLRNLDFSMLADIFFTSVILEYDKKLKNPIQSECSKCEILDILSNSIQHEPVLSRFDFVLSGVLDTIHELLVSGNSSIKLSVYKFYRQVIRSKDSYLISYFIKSLYFNAVFDELSSIIPKENMIFSSILAVITEICSSCDRDLLEYIYKTFSNRFVNTSVHSIFSKIQGKLDSIPNTNTIIRQNSSLGLQANENSSEIPDALNPTKRSGSIRIEPIKKLKLN
jgi:Component of IIS longevity pathway SMK-1